MTEDRPHESTEYKPGNQAQDETEPIIKSLIATLDRKLERMKTELLSQYED